MEIGGLLSNLDQAVQAYDYDIILEHGRNDLAAEAVKARASAMGSSCEHSF